MLRARPARVLPPLTASRVSQRLIWSRASDFVAWLGLGPSTTSHDSSVNPSKQASIKCETLPTQLTVNRVLRPQASADAVCPTFQKLMYPKQRKEAAYALDCFLQKVKHVPTAKELVDVWEIVSQYRPFVVQKKEQLQVRLASMEDVGDERLWLLQLVPGNIFAQLSANISPRSMFVGSMRTDLDNGDVVVANEALLVGNLVKGFYGMNEHELVVAFFEAYDRDRSVWLQEHQVRVAAQMPEDGCSDGGTQDEATSDLRDKQVSIKKVTQLPRAVYTCYLRSLAALRKPKTIVRLFENDKDQLKRICSTVFNLRVILHACYNEKNGNLAKQAIDTTMECSPAVVIPLGCYELAIRANLYDRKRDERKLLNAIHLAQALLNDDGYILKPDIWSRLIKVSLSLGRTDLALDVFKTYPRHCVPEYHRNFCQVLRAASRLTDSTVLEMMRFCWVGYHADYPDAKALLDERKAYQDTICLNNPEVEGDAVLTSNISALNKDAETDMLNTMLWELLKHHRAVSSVVQVLDLMEATRSKGGAVALRKAVLSMFEYDMKENKTSPRAALESSLKFWGEHSSVLYGQGFLVHVLLEECLEHQLDDECEFLVDYLLDLGVSRVPINSIIKMMGSNELRGHFKANARIGDKLLQRLSQSNRGKLRDDFYERYLMSYLRLEQFDKVSQQYANFKLEQRYPHNEVIRKIVQDAAAQ